MKFTEDHARKVAEKLFPHDVFINKCNPKCKQCDSDKESWEMKIREVLLALRILEV